MRKLILALALAFAALNVSAATEKLYYKWVFSGSGTNDNDVLFTTEDVGLFDRCSIISTAGAVDVYMSPTTGGNDFSTAAYSLTDMGATDTNPVLSTVAGRWYGFVFAARRIKVLQFGATAATAYLICWTPGQDALLGR